MQEITLPAQRLRARSSERLLYEAEVELIKREHGDLEKIREKLGLSQRRISQLLMVDPSAWTRWVKKGDAVPPHIYRSLHWYLLLLEKAPEDALPLKEKLRRVEGELLDLRSKVQNWDRKQRDELLQKYEKLPLENNKDIKTYRMSPNFVLSLLGLLALFLLLKKIF